MGQSLQKLAENNQDLTATPLLDLFENYAGSFHDLDRNLKLSGDNLRTARDALTAGLVGQKVAAGDRVLLAVGNGPGFIVAFVAVLSVGGSPVLVHVDTPPAELVRLSREYDAQWALCDAWTENDLSTVSESLSDLQFAPEASLTLATFQRPRREQRRLPPIVAMPLHPTSGTTGIPKLAARHGLAAIAEPRHYQQAMGIGPEDTILCVVPMSHAYGFGTSAIMPLTSGASLVSSRRFQPHAVFRAMREYSITTFPAVPAMLHLLLVASRGPIEGLPRRVLSAGAPLAEHTAREFFEKNGQTAWSLYGSTETGGICVDVEAPPDAAPGSVGPKLDPVSVQIIPL
ncbi:MAG TPA: AMP-binding protein, partial [Planctomycetaceae bacterium]|nr:AMP-binding protein [Planctomycetaceae bacterium]